MLPQVGVRVGEDDLFSIGNGACANTQSQSALIAMTTFQYSRLDLNSTILDGAWPSSNAYKRPASQIVYVLTYFHQHWRQEINGSGEKVSLIYSTKTRILTLVIHEGTSYPDRALRPSTPRALISPPQSHPVRPFSYPRRHRPNIFVARLLVSS